MTGADLHIRRAGDEDAPELFQLIRTAMAVYARQSGIATQLDAQAETLDDLLDHIRRDQVLVAIHRGSLAGTARLVHVDAETAYFCRFAVLPSLHRSGVGRRLFQAAEQWLLENGYRQVSLHTALSNQPLVAFYRARGYKLVETSTDRGYPRGTFKKILTPEPDQLMGKSLLKKPGS